MSSKPFTETAYRKFDRKAREALRNSTLLQTFLRREFHIDDFSFNPDKYGVDFLGYDLFGDFERGVEVETKTAPQFRNGTFGFATVHFAGRKLPLFEAGDLLVQFDGRYEFAIIVDPRQARFYIESKTTNRNAGEEDFVAVPLVDVFIVKVDPSAQGSECIRPRIEADLCLDGL